MQTAHLECSGRPGNAIEEVSQLKTDKSIRRQSWWNLEGIAILVGVLVNAGAVAFGQNAQVSGQVSDPNNAFVPGVEITVQNAGQWR